MILMYHKVDATAPTRWWVKAETFARQMAALEGRRVVPLSAYDPADPSHVAITFDDAYACVLEHAVPLLARHGYPFEVFVNGALIGGWNDFDPGEPRARIAGEAELDAMVEAGARLQWHTATHRDVTGLAPDELVAEMQVPQALLARYPEPHFTWFCYPYGAWDDRSAALAGILFDGAVAVWDGDPADRITLPRITADEALDLEALRAGRLRPEGAPRPRTGRREARAALVAALARH